MGTLSYGDCGEKLVACRVNIEVCPISGHTFNTTTSRFVSWMGASLWHVRSCDSLKMIFGTRPHGHLPRLCSFVTFTPSSLTSTTAKRSVHRLRHRSTEELVLD
jgi:hypothetical protein